TVSLRTSVGDITRAQAPFASWLRESIAVWPIFVLAVLGALTLALSRFGSHLGRPRAVITTALLVAAAGTVAGVSVLAASSVYDYHLQVQQLHMMGSMGGRCAGDCLAHQQRASLLLQVKSVAYGGGILLVTNLVVVAWMVAIRGGRLEVTGTRRRATRVLPRQTTHADGLRLVMVVGLLGSAAVHAGTVLAQRPAIGILSIALTAIQLATAVRLLARPGRNGALAAAVVSVGALAVGLPFLAGSGGALAPGFAEAMALVLEVGTLAAAVVLLRARPWLDAPPASAHGLSLALVAVLAVAVLGLGGTGLAWFDVVGTTGDHTGATSVHQ
ncbi:MAG: hypothetical protein ACJ72A_17480, partial [Nocardioidaceae bacterium]